MKHFALVSSLSVLVAVLLANTASVEAHKHAIGGHHDDLWSEDRAAYRSYRELSPIEISARARGSVLANSFDAGIEAVDSAYLESSLRILAGEKDPVMTNRATKAGRAAARVFMTKEFEAAGFKTHEENYGSGVNLVAERAGKSGKFLIVSAHYDSVSNPGADDDGTGVISMLQTAKMLGSRDLENGVRFVAFDEEELGLVGSKAYVKALVARGEKPAILGNFQMEMMGYNSRKDGKFHVISCDRPDSQFLVDAFASVISRVGTGISVSAACTKASDHASFWKAGIPAIVTSENFFGGDSNPCYHEKCDDTKLVDWKYFSNIAEASANVVIQIATTELRLPTPAPEPAPTEHSGSSWPK